MDWPISLLIMFGLLIALMATGMPIAFAFMITCVIGSVLFWGGAVGLNQLSMSVFSSVTSFALLPIPLFVLMGNIIFESGVGLKMVDAVDKILGSLPGRLSLLAIGAGTLLGTMIGISGGSIAILGRSLVPEMTKRGYQKPMSLGPVVASGTLATLIPPSALAVFLGAIGQVSVGKLLMAIIVPGLLLAALFATYIIIRCKFQPSIAPSYKVARVAFLERVNVTVRYIMPLAIVIFAVIGVVFIGIATPSEAAAFGAVACFLLAVLYKRFNLKLVKDSAVSTIEITVMVLMIVVGSITFSRILATSGAIVGLVEMATSLPVPPVVVIIMTQLVVVFLGCFMDPASIVMIAVPMFMPIVTALGFNPLWYAVVLLLNIQLGLITPPFGLDVYTMKALAPPDISVGDVFRSSMPFLAIGFLVMALIMIFPQLATWLPSMMVR
jgi:tripartite ATP-independent transporter DctM subunit